MYSVRSITAYRAAVTTTHDSKSKAKLEIKTRHARGDVNAMIVPQCAHATRIPASHTDKYGQCRASKCADCGMIVSFNLPHQLDDITSGLFTVEVVA